MKQPTIHMILLALLALGAAQATAQAQTVYRSVMPDGRIVYGDKAAPGARDAREVELPPPNLALPEPVSEESGKTRKRASGLTGVPQPSALDVAQEAVVKASEDLDRARVARDRGVEPRAGETAGTAISGRRRHTEAYEERQKALEDAVVAAEKRLNEALDRRNAQR